jgi:lipopolysaccharide transport system ATP-binding protein
MATAIEFNNISKLYRLGLVSTGTLRHDLHRWWTMNVRGKEDPYLRIGEENDRSVKGGSDYVWALRDIDFKVEQGDVVGIIGKNGAGKSTLLKILSRVTAPTTGTIRARGRIGSLLEVGTGFHPEMTGRENIYLNGAILGMTKEEISRKLDEIVDFSGCERYLDTPVKRYSSGMMVRLGFAVAAHLDPEILVVDEVLAVGDAEFQKKAIGKMQDVSQGEGRTVLFVSHNMAAVRSLCKKGILLENGRTKNIGVISDIVDEYLSEAEEHDCRADFPDDDAPGTENIKLRHVQLVNDACTPITFGYITDRIGICVDYEVTADTAAFTHGLNLFDTSGIHLFTSHDNTFCGSDTVKKGHYRTIAWIPANLLQSRDYYLTFAFMRYSPFEVLFHSQYLIKIHMVDDLGAPTRNEHYNEDLPGLIRPVIEWSPKTNI